MSPRSPKSISGSDTAEDISLFREAVRDVKPLERPAPAADHPAERPRRPRPAARFSRADRLAVLEESLRDDVIDPALASGEELVFHRAGIQASVLRKLGPVLAYVSARQVDGGTGAVYVLLSS